MWANQNGALFTCSFSCAPGCDGHGSCDPSLRPTVRAKAALSPSCHCWACDNPPTSGYPCRSRPRAFPLTSLLFQNTSRLTPTPPTLTTSKKRHDKVVWRDMSQATNKIYSITKLGGRREFLPPLKLCLAELFPSCGCHGRRLVLYLWDAGLRSRQKSTRELIRGTAPSFLTEAKMECCVEHSRGAVWVRGTLPGQPTLRKLDRRSLTLCSWGTRCPRRRPSRLFENIERTARPGRRAVSPTCVGSGVPCSRST